MKKILLILSLFISFQSQASHLLGSDMSYRQVGVDSFMITFHIYKDCRSRSLNRPILNIQTKLGTYYNDTIPFTKIGCMDVTPICSYGCSKCDHQNCNGNIGDTTCTFAYGVEKLSYEGLFVVPQNANAKYYRFKAFISETSRTIGSVNCCGYSAIHHNYIEFTPTIWSKSSPVFNFQHTYILPVGQYQKIDFSAIDSIDGDSLSYEFDYANSLSSGNGYSSPYKFNLPFDFVGFPVKNPNPNIPGSGLVLDSLTGYIYVTPKYQQSAIVVVKVKEWRKDSSGFMQNIGFVRRDINCIFMTSMSNKIPSITGKKEVYVCDLDTFKLDFKSVDKDSSDTLHVEVVNPLPGMIIKHSYDSGYNKILTHIDWKPTSNMARQQPYYLVLKVRDNSCPIIGENSFIVKIHVYDSSGALGFNVRSTCDDFIINPKNNYLNQLHWKIIDSSNQVLLADTIEQIKIRLSKPGSYPIQLITGEHSCKISYYDTLKVFPKTLKIDLGLDTTICTYKGFHLVFPIKPRINGLIGTKTRYDWYNIQSQFKFSIDSIETINYLVSSNYNVLWSCVVTDSIGCRATDTINVKILGNRYTPGSFQNIYNGCESDSVKITAPKWTNQTQYKWANGDTNAATMVYDSGYYMLQLSDNGCITSDSIKVVKFSNPKVLPMLDKWICNGDSVVLKSNTQADSLIWDQLYAQDSIFVKSSGLHLVRFLNKYKISNTEYICGASDSVYVYHHPLQGLDLGTNDSICSGDSLLLSANHAYTSYIWSNGVQSESFFTKNAGTYYLTVIDTNGCREQDSIYVFIRSQPDASFTYSFLAARDVQFVPSMTNYMKYKWLFGDGDSSGLVSPAHQYTAGNFSSSLKVTDMYSCEDSSSQSIFITGIGNPVTNEELDVYPNPFKDKVYIIYEGKSSQLEVIDLHGKVVKKMKIVKGMNEIDLKEYPSGIYLLRIEGGESTKILKLE